MLCKSEHTVFADMNNSPPLPGTLKEKISICEVIADNKQETVHLRRRQCLFEFLFLNDISAVAVFISSEPEYVLLSPENPSGDSASHLQRLFLFLYFRGSSSKLNIWKPQQGFWISGLTKRGMCS